MNLKAFRERWTLRLIIITPLASLAILTVVITSFYIEKLSYYFKENAERYLNEYVAGEQRQGEALVKDISILANDNFEHLEESVKKELDDRLALAHKTALFIYNKYQGRLSDEAIKERIIDALSSMQWYGKKNYVWITDYEGNNILSGSQELKMQNLLAHTDADGRAIILEEIQIARKYGEGYLKTRFTEGSSLQMIKVIDFKHFNWFFGSGIHLDHAMEEKKTELLHLLQTAPKGRAGYIALFEDKQPVYISEKDEKELSSALLVKMQQRLKEENGWVELPQENALIYVHYFKPFDWHIVYGFRKAFFNAVLQDQQVKMNKEVEEEIRFITYASVFIALLVGILTFIVSRHIIAIIRNYKTELESRELQLRELNASLQERVREEVHAHREKEKMLIQQSKMAAMGDMISMIAHQWRQPLNQISYVLMNIEAAYEYKELTPQYMDDKVKEGTKILEYMSHTIDDFKNFFKPDKERTEEQISEIVDHTIGLIKKSLESQKIALEIKVRKDTSLLVYRNELMQVLLNILTNAKDALSESCPSEPKIEILVDADERAVCIEICDNGGGIDQTVMDKIFEPYFSTKGAKSGTGLGLYMSKTIVEEHLNGKIRVYNTDIGVCFELRLNKPTNV
ncbi:cache domain-containing protein [Sulfurimonas sp. HSL3-7]|uniref:sensor histidine kinase n=1 Tax=Sulfonitrofixus jiaomeiensis TaxID=3131938 RepID=UPI0031F7C685